MRKQNNQQFLPSLKDGYPLGVCGEVENCSGHYVTHILSYCNLRKVKTDKYNISVEEYNSLSDLDKKGYNKVVEFRCNVCNDSLDDRLRNVWVKKIISINF